MRLRVLGSKYNLHVDQLGILEQEIVAVLTGASATEDFVEKIEEDLSLSTEQAIDIATDVNMEIFLPVRESLIQPQEIETPSESIASDDSERAQILAEIEDPTPVQHPISIAQDAALPAIPRAQEVSVATAPVTTPQTAARDFIATKLTETAPSPVQKKPYVDPYREAVN